MASLRISQAKIIAFKSDRVQDIRKTKHHIAE